MVRSGRPGAMSTSSRAACFAALLLLVVGCGGAGTSAVPPVSGAPSGAPTAAPSASPSSTPGAFGAIEHPTGATDVVLRFEQGGGFVNPTFLATQTPIFTLYGDGTIVFRNPAADMPPAVGSVQPFVPLRTAKLTEEQIQALLEMALGEGGLGAARLDYPSNQVADAPTSTFTVNAGGIKKRVAVYALGIDAPGMPDAIARAAFGRLAERLSDFDRGGSFPTAAYSPERYRGIMMDGALGDPGAKPWPWKDVAPSDFVPPADPNAFQLATKVLTAAQVEALAITPPEGGFQGLTLTGPDKKLYSLSLRPLLPDDAS